MSVPGRRFAVKVDFYRRTQAQNVLVEGFQLSVDVSHALQHVHPRVLVAPYVRPRNNGGER